MAPWAGRLAAAALCALTSGCAGRGSVELIELNFKRLSDQEPLIAKYEASECWWWVDDDRVCVSFSRNRPAVLNTWGKHQFDLSLVLPGAPADRARDYVLGQQALRGYLHEGANHFRYASLRGIAGIKMNANGTLDGRFRFMGLKRSFHILTGWSTVGQVVIVGEFHAAQGAQSGLPILLRTEEEGMTRTASDEAPEGGPPRPAPVTGPPVD